MFPTNFNIPRIYLSGTDTGLRTPSLFLFLSTVLSSEHRIALGRFPRRAGDGKTQTLSSEVGDLSIQGWVCSRFPALVHLHFQAPVCAVSARKRGSSGTKDLSIKVCPCRSAELSWTSPSGSWKWKSPSGIKIDTLCLG